MRLGARLRQEKDRMGRAFPGWDALAARTAGGPVTISGSNLNRWALEPDEEQVGKHPEAKLTAWGGISTIDQARRPSQLVAVCRIFAWSHRSAWLNVGESIGLSEMDRGSVDDLETMLSSGAYTLDQNRRALLRQYSEELVSAQDAEQRLEEQRRRAQRAEAELEAQRRRADAAEARVAELEAQQVSSIAPKRRRNTP